MNELTPASRLDINLEDVLGNDFRIATAWFATLRAGKNIDKTEKDIRGYLKKIVWEIVKRDKVTFNPATMKDTSREILADTLWELFGKGGKGIFAPPPHSQMIADGRKMLKLAQKPWDLEGFHGLLDGKDVIGMVRFEDRQEIDEEAFEKRKDEHKVTRDELEAWGWNFPLSGWKIREFVSLTKPMSFKVSKDSNQLIDLAMVKLQRYPEELRAKGIESFADVSPGKLKELTNKEMVLLDAWLHASWEYSLRGDGAERDPILNADIFVAEEKERRGMERRVETSLDFAVERFRGTQMARISDFQDACLQATGPKLTNERSKLRPANPENETERCGFCVFFQKPDGCKIVDGPVTADLVCDWIQSRGLEEEAPTYEVSDEDWIPFGVGMIAEQPYQHIVIDVAVTPAGPMVLIQDTAETPHRFSLGKEFHIGHTCFDSETHAVTEHGILRFDELTTGMRIWSMDPETEMMVLKPIDKIFTYDYDGDLLRFRGKKYDFAVTPNHNVLCKLHAASEREESYREARKLIAAGARTSEISKCLDLPQPTVSRWRGEEPKTFSETKWRFEKASKLFSRYKFYLPRPTSYQEALPPELPSDHDAYFALVGWYLSEGWSTECNGSTCISFAAAKDETVEIIQSLIRRLGFEPKLKKGPTCQTVYLYKRMFADIFKDFGRKAYQKRIPISLKAAPKRLLSILFNSYIDGDGSRKGAAITATTTSKQLRDDLVEIGFKLGYYPSSGYIPSKRAFIVRKEYDCREAWYISFSRNKGTACNGRHENERLPYKGKIWCATVKNTHNLLVERKGKFVFSGNSFEHHWTQEEVDELIDKGRAKLSSAAELHEIKSGRLIYLNDVMKHFKDIYLSKPHVYLVGSLAINGRGHDIDVLIRGEEDCVLEFRILKLFPPYLQKRVRFIYDPDGPFTSHLPLYALKVEKMNSEIVSMEDDIEERDEIISLQRLVKQPPMPDDAKTEIDKWKKMSRKELTEIDAKKLPQWFWIIQEHYRGKSAHDDFRIKQNGNLEGWTITGQVAGAIPDVNTLADAKKVDQKFDDPKTFKFRPSMDPAKVKVVAVMKDKQPLELLNRVNEILPKGTPGATKGEDGIFYAKDWGCLWPGAKKEDFEEYFIFGRRFEGRLIFRLVDIEEKGRGLEPGARFFTWMAKDQKPLIMTRRARVETREDIPPDGISWLPPNWEAVIPKEMRWWDDKLTDNKKLDRMDQAYNHLIDEGVLAGRKLPEV